MRKDKTIIEFFDGNDNDDSEEEFKGGMTTEMPYFEMLDENVPQEYFACLDIFLPGELPRRQILKVMDLVIGRDESCGLVISSQSISRKHAKIVYSNEEYTIEDLGSTNGILVNGVKVSRSTLKNNDVIRIGKAKLIYQQQTVASD